MSHLYYGNSLDLLPDGTRYDSPHLTYYTPPFHSKGYCNLPFTPPKRAAFQLARGFRGRTGCADTMHSCQEK